LVKAEVVGVARFVLFSNVALGAAHGIKMLAVRDARVCTSLGQHGGGNNGKEGSCFHVFNMGLAAISTSDNRPCLDFTNIGSRFVVRTMGFVT